MVCINLWALGLDEEGRTKNQNYVSYITRGTKASMVSSRVLDEEGGSTEEESNQNYTLQDSSQGEAEADEEEPSSRIEGEDDEYNEGEGESESDEDHPVEATGEEIKEEDILIAVENKGKKTENNGPAPVNANNAEDNPANKLGKHMLTMNYAIEKLLKNSKKEKEVELIIEGDEKEIGDDDEEQFNWEEIDFKNFQVNNSGNIFKQKPEVLCCCTVNANGYKIENRLYASSLEDEENFVFNEKPYFSACGEFIGFYNKGLVAIYKAKTLKLVHNYRIEILEEIPDFEYIENFMISAKCKYFTIKEKNGRHFFTAKDGKQIGNEEFMSEKYQRFINEYEMIGTGFQENGSSKIVTINIKNKKVKQKVEFDLYLHSIIINSGGKACVVEQDNVLYYVDLYRDAKTLVKLLEGYDHIKFHNINNDNVSLIYSEDTKLYLALYTKAKLAFRKKIDMTFFNFPKSINATEDGQVIYVENTNKMFIADEHNFKSISFEDKVYYHYPIMFYPYEKNEIWVQYINNPKIINRYVFINTITSYSLTDLVYNEVDREVNAEGMFIELLLTYEKCHRIAQIAFEGHHTTLMRMQKPIYFTDLPNSSILSFTSLKAINEKSKEELCVMFHFVNQLKFVMLKSLKVKKHHEANFKTRNIIKFADRIFIWEDKGRGIDRIECSVKKDEKTFFYKAYDAKNVIKMCKKIHYKPGVECLIISDEDKYVKILSYDQINKRLKVEKEYYVHKLFATNDDLDGLENFKYCNGILYSNDVSYILQKRGSEKGDLPIEVTSENFKVNSRKFPL